jgi:hypothetical protein
MRLVSIQDMSELSTYYQDIKTFADSTKPKYSSHVIDVLIEWFKSFSSDEKCAFASKRGLNFFGRKSNLHSLLFLLAYDGNELVALAPLFRFTVHVGEGSAGYEVISFCPDSTVFFYNDFLIKKGSEARALETFLEFFKHYNKATPYIILLNHIPSSSSTLPLVLEHSTDLPLYGFNVSISPIFWRGGLYPWNLGDLKLILRDALNNNSFSNATKQKIASIVDTINASNKTMLVFKRNHPTLKSLIYSIFNEGQSSDDLFHLYNAVESIFRSYPIKYPYLTLPKSSDIFVNSLSSSKRYYYKRYRSQFLASDGQIVKIHGRSVADQDIRDFISLHRERWGNNSNILNRSTSSFLFSFLQNLSLNDLLTLFFAVYQSKRVACMCCIDFEERREFFSSGRTLGDEKLRAGKLLLFEAIVDSIQGGLHVFDFGYGEVAYKSDFNWSYVTNNVIALFHDLHPKQFSNIFPLYEEVML